MRRWPAALLALVLLLPMLAVGAVSPVVMPVGAEPASAAVPGPDISPAVPGWLSAAPSCPEPERAGAPPRAIPIKELRQTVHASQGALSWAVSGLPELTAMSSAITRSVEANAVVFPGVRGQVAGFLPGSIYHELYIRDTASVLLVAPYLYGDVFLRSAIEEFLFRQWTSPAPRLPGQPAFPGMDAIYGLISAGGWADKSTATSDEEPTLVHSAYRYARSVGGRAWLDCDIYGRTVLERLHAALDHLVTTRTDPVTGLVIRAHTTDWGDVRMQGGEHPTHADPTGEYWTVSIYDQAVIYLAMRQLAELHRLADDHSAARLWDQRAATLRAQTNRFLWQPARGFYRTHLHVTPLEHPFDEDAMVSIANGVAVYAGLADEAQARRIFAALEAARLAVGVSKPGLALYPPYPPGTFQHPNMNHWHYQNAGQWDWWGAVQITAEFQNGQSELGLAHLSALARSWQQHPGTIMEWQDPLGGPDRGSDDYAATGGTAGEAVIRGLFGVELYAEGFALRPRLGGRDGFIQLQQPATGNALWARQRVQDGALTLEYNAVHSGEGLLEVLLPQGLAPGSVRFDGIAQGFTVRQHGEDRFLSVGTVPPGTHRLDVTLRPEAVPAPGVVWSTDETPPLLAPNRWTVVPVGLVNLGAATWQRTGSEAVRLRARWLDEHGQTTPTLAQELEVPQAVAPGGVTRLRPVLRTPEQTGRYRLRWELVMGTGGAAAPSVEVQVQVTNTALGQRWLGAPQELTVTAGQQAEIALAVENTGFDTWQAKGLTPVRLGYRWFTAAGRELPPTAALVPIALPADVPPGATVRLTGQIAAPAAPGRYELRWDLIKAPETWFSRAYTNPTADIMVQVVP